jgi:glucose/arabinose dehydrogenase
VVPAEVTNRYLCSRAMHTTSARFLRRLGLALLLAAPALVSGCYVLRGSSGGGQTQFQGPRAASAEGVALPAGYRIEAVATGLTFPSGVAFDDAGRPYVLEAGYSYGEAWTIPRLLRVEADGRTTPLATGANPPWNGVAFHRGAFYVAEGGHRDGGRILRIGMNGAITPLVQGLPSLGDHHTNGPAIGPDGRLYFAQGTATNSGVVGEDNHQFGWLSRNPGFHDVPCRDVTLTGENFTTGNPLTPDEADRATTGAFVPFGTPTVRGQTIRGRVPCSGAVMRIPLAGGTPEVVAWGFRNPFGIAWSPEGRLYVSDNQYDDRGSRPVWGGGDLLWSVEPGSWYGWPDFHGGRALSDADQYKPPGKPRPAFLLAEHPNPPPRPAAILGVHSSSNGFDFSRSAAFGHAGEAFVAQFGDMAPGVGKVLSPVGFKVVRVEVATGVVHDFAVNRGSAHGPASRIGGGGLERPIAVRFNPSGDALYLVDFGVMTMGPRGPEPRAGTGVLWRITRTGGGVR